MTRKRKPIHSIVLYLLLIGFSAVFMVPMIWMLSTSAKSLKQVYSTKPQFFDWPIYIRENYNYVIQSYHFFSYFGNTLKVAVIATFGRVLSSAMAGYAFARIDFPGRKVLFAIALCTMMIPSQVTQIPTYIIYSRIHWLDSYLPMTVPSYFGNVFSIFLMRQFFLSVPQEIEDAAKIDGCGSWRIFTRIMILLAKAGIITITLFAFLDNWDDFQGALLYLDTPRKYTLSLFLNMFKSQAGIDKINYLMAASVMTVAPKFVMYFFSQKQFMNSLSIAYSMKKGILK